MPVLTRRELLAAAALAAVGVATGCARPATDSRAAETALADLAKRLRGSVVRAGAPNYEKLATPRNLRFAATMPQAVVLCADAADVATAVQWAQKTGTAFAIRGGGHNYLDASSSRGIIICTRTMNTATIDGTTMRAQAGVRNADLAALLPQGGRGRLLLPGGNCAAVGVVGLTLGGGIGPNAAWAGLTADRLQAVTMVTAAGGGVTASATENPDLFWALGGGTGGNFGVVTDLEYELVEVPVTRATTGLLTFRGRDAVVASALAFQQVRAGNSRTVTGTWVSVPARGDVAAELRVQVLAGEDGTRDLLAPLLAIPGVQTEIIERPWWDAYAWYVTVPSPPYAFWDRSLYADRDLSGDAITAALEVLRRFPVGADDQEGALSLFGWVGGAVNDAAADATAYVHRSARVLIEIATGWATPPDSAGPIAPVPADIAEWVEQLWEVLLPHTTARSYQNFPDPQLSDWASAYYGDNLARLQGVKATWDPGDVFAHRQGIPLPR